MKPNFAVYDRTESLFESAASDLITFGLLFLCIYVSRDSTFWTLVAGVMFFMALSAKFTAVGMRQRKLYFKTKAEVLAWANELPDDTKVGAGETAEVAE